MINDNNNEFYFINHSRNVILNYWKHTLIVGKKQKEN